MVEKKRSALDSLAPAKWHARRHRGEEKIYFLATRWSFGFFCELMNTTEPSQTTTHYCFAPFPEQRKKNLEGWDSVLKKGLDFICFDPSIKT